MTEQELKEVARFLDTELAELEEISKELESITESHRGIRISMTELSTKEFEVIERSKARILSTLTITTTYVSSLIEKFKLLPAEIYNRLKQFYEKIYSIISKFINLFEIEQITLTISVQPALQIIFKPKQT
ncbi:MAG: hypothetical protein RMI32_07555 [Candidatus Nitrosocaldus sp.]|nr:hypothetical protein [Candidatus Nitrosocaldus sp.]